MPQLYRSDFAFRFCIPILHSLSRYFAVFYSSYRQAFRQEGRQHGFAIRRSKRTTAPTTAPGRTRISRMSDPRQDQRHPHQATDQSTRPGAGLLAGRRGAMRRDRRRSCRCLQIHRPRQPGCRHHQWHRSAGSGQHRPAGIQAGDGRQGRAVQEICRHRRVRYRDQ